MLRINETDSQAKHLQEWLNSGVDDFIVAKGQSAFDALYNTAETLQLWEIKLFTLLTYPPAIALNQRFLGQLLVPEGEKLIILKAPKGSGKTEWLSTEVAKAHDQGRRVLIITHRIQLGEALCNRFGVNYVTEVRTNETGDLLGYGLCIDSLHQDSQARFNPNDWSNDVIIIDECDQVFWHLLNSATDVQKRRVSILKNLKQLIQNVLGSSQGKIYLSSADVADGYTVIDADDCDPDETKEVVESVKAASKELYSGECQKISQQEDISDAELKKLQEKRVKTSSERYQQRKAELSRRYEVEVTPDLVEKDDDSWYPQLRLHYYLTLGREFLTKRDAKRAKSMAEALENSIWKPDFNKGQLLSGVFLLEKLNLLQLLKSGERLRGSSEAMQELKRAAVENRYLIKTCLNVIISDKLTPVVIAQKLLSKIDLRLSYIGRLGPRGNRESVYQFVAPKDERNLIFEQWLNRDELSNRELVSVINNIDIPTFMSDTISPSISQNSESVSVTNNIKLQTLPCDTHNIPLSLNEAESPAVSFWKGLKLQIRQGLNGAGKFYQELVSSYGEAVGTADGEPIWNHYLGSWQVVVNFADGCKSVMCDWVEYVE